MVVLDRSFLARGRTLSTKNDRKEISAECDRLGCARTDTRVEFKGLIVYADVCCNTDNHYLLKIKVTKYWRFSGRDALVCIIKYCLLRLGIPLCILGLCVSFTVQSVFALPFSCSRSLSLSLCFSSEQRTHTRTHTDTQTHSCSHIAPYVPSPRKSIFSSLFDDRPLTFRLKEGNDGPAMIR